jgi:hypothetical protein
MEAESLKMKGCWVAFMLGEAVFGMEAVVFEHEAVALDLGDHTRRSDAQAEGVPADEGGLRDRKIVDGQAIDQGVVGSGAEFFQGAAHSLVRGAEDVEAVDFGGVDDRRGPADAGIRGDSKVKRLATARGEFFRVVKAGQVNVKGKNDHRAYDRTGQWTPPSFIDPCDAMDALGEERMLAI